MQCYNTFCPNIYFMRTILGHLFLSTVSSTGYPLERRPSGHVTKLYHLTITETFSKINGWTKTKILKELQGCPPKQLLTVQNSFQTERILKTILVSVSTFSISLYHCSFLKWEPFKLLLGPLHFFHGNCFFTFL